ncbi:MAG: glycosyltransferase family 39 protein [bacterium]|nr:glycosyltransferase family 39 protein [bacterium]
MENRKLFLWMLPLSTCIRLLLAGIIPITGDEAYFIVWAKHLNYGYYEHPPMIGWIMWLFSFLGDNIFVYRIFPLFVIPLIALLIVKILSNIDKDKAYLCGSVFLLSPVGILNVLSVNDVPLILFTFLTGLFFYRGMNTKRGLDAMLSGFFGGCAFLSKYFFMVFVFSLFIFCMVSRKKYLWKILTISLISGLPLVFINVLWNYNNCWLNVMFNLFFRNRNLAINFDSVFVFLVEQFFLMTPFLAIIFVRNCFFSDIIKRDDTLRLFWYLFMVPLVFFLLLSFIKKVGLHWMASFYPFFFIFLILLPQIVLDRAMRYNLYFSIIVLLFILVTVSLPVEIFKNTKKYPQIVMFMRPVELCKAIYEIIDGEQVLASTGYTEVSLLRYYCNRDVVLFGSLSKSGRCFDFINDFRNYNGKNFLIVSLNKRDVERFTKLFVKVDSKTIDIFGAKFYFIFGEQFIFNNYRELYLRKILQMYYNPPSFLPISFNFFKERYFSESSSSN